MTDTLTFTGTGGSITVHDSRVFNTPGTFTGKVAIHHTGSFGANATGTVSICIQDECLVCGGNHCSCLAGILASCNSPLTCTGAQSNLPCCSGTNAASAQCTNAQGGGGDLIQSTNNERCLSGICVGCVTGTSGFPTFNLCGGGNSFGFLTSADSSTVKGLCAAMTHITIGNSPGVSITSWSIVHPPLLFAASGVTQAYLNQFVGTFRVTVGAKVIILTCVPVANGAPCSVANIYISTDPTFCYAEFVVSSNSLQNAVIGGTLLSPNPFN